MPSTYTRLYIQLVFAVKGRRSLIHESWEDELYKYITGIVQKSGHKMLQINGMPDHIHIFIGYNPNQRIPDLVKDIKTTLIISSKKGALYHKSLTGSKDTEPSHMPSLKRKILLNTSKIKKNIIVKKASRKNILIYFKHLK